MKKPANEVEIDGVLQGWASGVLLSARAQGMEPKQQAPRGPTPAELDSERFQLDESVSEWQSFTTRFSSIGSEGRYRHEARHRAHWLAACDQSAHIRAMRAMPHSEDMRF